MKLNRGGVDLWWIALDKVKHEISALDARERAQADSFHHPEHRAHYIAAHWACRVILARYLAVEPAALELVHNPYGKPYIANSELRFNLSHSGVVAGLAVSWAAPVGFDVEAGEHVELRSLPWDLILSAEEKHLLSSGKLSLNSVSFRRLWTRKEAVVKATGRGLSQPLTGFTVFGRPEQSGQWVETSYGRFWLRDVAIRTPDAAALCSTKPFSISIFDFIELASHHAL